MSLEADAAVIDGHRGPAPLGKGDGHDPVAGPSVRLGSQTYAVLGPSIRDPRLHAAACLLTVQLLGLSLIGFELSIVQLLAAISTCAAIEIVVVARRSHEIAWPASALLTGNGIALLLRVNGTENGDWWSANGTWIFIGTAALAMGSKYLIRFQGRHLFNPSNLALVVTLLVLGSGWVSIQDFWWGPVSAALAVTVAVIVVGGVTIAWRLGLLETAITYYVVLAIGVGLLALVGHQMRARWNVDPVSGWSLWSAVVTSPEILIFMFFMVPDPRVVPIGRSARRVFAGAAAVFGVALASTQQTEFGVKVSVLAGLTLACLVRPLLERGWPARDEGGATGARRVLSGGAVIAAALFLGASAAFSATSPRMLPSSGPVVDRPDVHVPDAAIPDPEISPEVLATSSALTEGEARSIVRDVIVDMEIERMALAAEDPAMLRTASVGARLEHQIARLGTGPTIEVQQEAQAARIILLRGSNPQSIPRLAVELSGVQRQHPGAVAVSWSARFEVKRVGDHYLISSVPQ